jgi:hypothetical protein
MQDLLNKKAAIFSGIHKKASRNLVNAAQDKVFTKYFEATTEAEKSSLKKEIEQISLIVQKRFKVDEMCLIADDGTELTRITFDKIAPDDDLSADETGAPFFAPSFKMPHRRAHVESPYMSADSARWVVAYATPIMANGGKKGILHYEIPMSFYIDEMKKGLSGDDRLLVVGNDGLLWTDTSKNYKLDGNHETAKASDYFAKFDDGSTPQLKGILSSMKQGKSGADSFTTDGTKYAIVYKPLGYFDWSIAVVRPE